MLPHNKTHNRRPYCLPIILHRLHPFVYCKRHKEGKVFEATPNILEPTPSAIPQKKRNPDCPPPRPPVLANGLAEAEYPPFFVPPSGTTAARTAVPDGTPLACWIFTTSAQQTQPNPRESVLLSWGYFLGGGFLMDGYHNRIAQKSVKFSCSAVYKGKRGRV